MKPVELAKAMLEQARDRLATAEKVYSTGNLPYAVRSSQECVELSLKAALRAVGIEYPKRHDVSRVLRRMKGRFPDWFSVEKFAATSRELVELREPAMYGDEIRMLSSSALFEREQVEEVLARAREVYNASQELLKSLETPRDREPRS